MNVTLLNDKECSEKKTEASMIKIQIGDVTYNFWETTLGEISIRVDNGGSIFIIPENNKCITISNYTKYRR